MDMAQFNDYDYDGEDTRSHRETSGDREGLYTYDNGMCDPYANGFDCRDCALADTCDHYRNYDD